MPQDAFTLKYVVRELDETFKNGKVSKIVQPERDTLTFFIYTKKGTLKLDVCLSARDCRMSVTRNDRPVPQTAPAFCMLLRKHLQNAEVLEIGQMPFERVAFIKFLCTSEFEEARMTLFCELMGKYSNATLVKDGVILGALKTTAIGENTRRVLFPGAKYVLPEAQDKISPDDIAGLKALFPREESDSARFISERVKGVAYSTAAEICALYGGNVTAENIRDYLSGDDIAPCVVFEGGEPFDFKVKSTLKDRKNFDCLLEAQTFFYDYTTAKRSLEEGRRRLLSAVAAAKKKAEKRLAVINQKLLDCRDAESVRLKGELITANIYALSRGQESFKAVNYYDENCEEIVISLDRSLTPAQNAQKYYKRYAKLRRTAEAAGVQKEQTESELDYLASAEAHVRAVENAADLEGVEEELLEEGLIKTNAPRKKKRVETPFRTFLIDGFTVLAGRSNVQNDRLLKRASPQDMWLHTQNYHSSHVVILSGGREISEATLLTAAEICAYYSDGRGGTKIPVDYTLRKFVKKPQKAAAGFVTYTDYKTILVTPAPHAESKEGV